MPRAGSAREEGRSGDGLELRATGSAPFQCERGDACGASGVSSAGGQDDGVHAGFQADVRSLLRAENVVFVSVDGLEASSMGLVGYLLSALLGLGIVYNILRYGRHK